ncbi:MAG TPA: CAP domain-containing protein [Oligoflexia bacterium]|nr:CAP domain-containing protein [Oligoflexia bacterium]HMR23929.1 CAP domain-containing protein [Oligoflexia bacterium]
MNRLSYAFIIFGVSLFLIHCSKTSYDYPSYAITETEQLNIDDFILLANQHRQNAGCNENLIWDHSVHVVAQLHSLDMQQNSYFSHKGLNGDQFWDRLANYNVFYTAAAENIAINSMQASDVLQAWIDSPGHRANLENCIYTHHGVGLASPGVWTHVFIRR